MRSRFFPFLLFVAVISTIVAVSCNYSGSRGTEKITVASQLADCTGVGQMKCLLIKHEGSDDWEFWYGGIQGFDYKPGYEYVLRIRREYLDEGPADKPRVEYVLVKVISQKEKRSENMPVYDTVTGFGVGKI